LHVNEQQQANQLASLQMQQRTLPNEHAQTIALLESEKARLSEQLTRNQASGEWLITAPKSGTVTNIALTQGASIRNQQYLLTVMPEHNALKAILLVPSRAFGFVEAGQPTKSRIQVTSATLTYAA
jgi:membrane fusion protein